MRTLQVPLILFVLHGEHMSQPSNPSQLDKGEASTGMSLQPMSFTDILDTTFSLYRNHFRLFVGISSVYFTSHIILTTFGHWLADWCDTALVILSYAGLAFASAGTYLGRRITFHTAFRQVVNRFKSYAGSGVLWLLVVLALSSTVIGIPVAIFLGTRWCFFPLTVLVEENSATTALRRSGELVKGAWWRVFSIMLAIFMIALTIELIFVIFSTSIIALSGIVGGMDYLELIRWCIWDESHDAIEGGLYLLHAINTAINALIMPIMAVGFTLLYVDQRIRKEGFDIEMMMSGKLD